MHATKSSQLENTVEGFCLIMAPLFLTASTLFWQNGEYGVEAAMLMVFSMFFWIPALIALFSFLKDKSPRYAVFGLWIAVLGCISGVCFAFLGYLATVFNISHQEYLQSLSKYPVSSQVLLFGSGPLFPVSLLILGINLIVTRSVALWTGILFCAGAIAFPLSRIPRIEWIAHLADISLFIPSAVTGMQIIGNRKTKVAVL